METLGVDYLTKQQYNLLGGDHDPVQIPVTIVSGAGALLGGTVLGRITASGKYTPYSATHTDGSEVARVILARDIDATSADAAVSAYVHGEF
ncbi:MAG: head decoration protein, partial [Nitrospirae bacterium]|nr:head decoration protein [Nitrospirota bacterium]